MCNFITNNKTKDLKKRILELISKSQELKFLVGFFYFSGLKELYQGLLDNKNVILKVLVGMNVDKTIYGIIEHSTNGKFSDEEMAYNFFNSIKKSINSDLFDNRNFYEQVKFFINLIKENKLILRKTYDPNHSKLYLFKLQEEQVGRNKLFITGSSNLTSAGLTKEQEFNVEISDYGFEETEDYYDKLWNNAVKITEDNIRKNNLIKILEQETLIKQPTPFEAYLLLLKNYIDSFEGKVLGKRLEEIFLDNSYKIYNYQFDAISQALSIIDQNNGVIIADVVGLGKTVIACAVAFELKKRGIVICPPTLIGDKKKKTGWKKYLEQFYLSKLGWEVYSSGDLENVFEIVKKSKDLEVIIIDEAHRFRNQDTRGYELLKNICRGKIVILLTATPFNNKPSDIFSLLKLFITPKKAKITLSDNLEGMFDEFRITFDKLAYIKRYHNSKDRKKRSKAVSIYKTLFGNENIDLFKLNVRAKYLSRKIKEAIEPVTIRRNRIDLQENPRYKNEVKDLPKVMDPIEWFFELSKEQSNFYDEIIGNYFELPENNGRFKGAIYKPFVYEKEPKDDYFDLDLTEEENRQFIQQFNLYDFMRRLLVKRFESSFGAFEQSIKNFKNISEIVREFINKTKKYILDRSLLEKIYKEDEDEIEKHLLEYSEKIRNGEYPKNHKIYEIEKFKGRDEFLSDIESDIKMFDEILEYLQILKLVEEDPKAFCLMKNLKEVLEKEPENGEPKRKAVIYSEYADTVKYLEPILQDAFKNRVLVVTGSNLTAGREEEIHKNFDASYEEQDDNYDILLTTDKISEGYDLNRAGIVINYDIPWNPVRVIQRVGRLNRIGKKVFDKIYIVNFFPTEKGSDLVKSRDIASNKMFLIHNALGEDSKIFDIDEEPSASRLYSKICQNPETFEGESFYTKILKEYEKLKNENPEIIKNLSNYPPRIKVSKKGKNNELIVAIRKGKIFIYHKDYDSLEKDNIILKSLEDVYESIIADKNEKPLPLSDNFWDSYEKIKYYKEKEVNRVSEQSLERKALNMLGTLLKIENENFQKYKEFIRMLREDILDYGTLSEFTLRRISNIDFQNLFKTVQEIKNLILELGENYLFKEKERVKDLTKEIIIAIENIKVEEDYGQRNVE